MPVSNSISIPSRPTFETSATATPSTSAPRAFASPTGFNSEDVFEASTNRSAAPQQERTALQKHVGFFDRNSNGQITLGETYDGLRALGFGRIRSSAFAFAINAGLGRATGASWWSPLTVNVDKIELGKHDSDTDVYDTNGRFNQEKFEAVFTKFDNNQDGALSEDEFVTFFARNRESTVGSFASKAEFGLLMEIAGEEAIVDGRRVNTLSQERLAEFYDGSLFYKVAGEPLPTDI